MAVNEGKQFQRSNRLTDYFQASVGAEDLAALGAYADARIHSGCAWLHVAQVEHSVTNLPVGGKMATIAAHPIQIDSVLRACRQRNSLGK